MCRWFSSNKKCHYYARKEQGRVSTDTANKQFIVIDKPHGRLDNKYDWEQSYIIDLVRWHLGKKWRILLLMLTETQCLEVFNKPKEV